MNELLTLIARNPSISKRTSSEDINLIDKYHKQVFKVGIADKGCYTCVLSAFNKLRVHVGYAPLNKMEAKNITKDRLEKCYTCPYRVENLLGDTCGDFANKFKDNPKTTTEGKVLCGCVLKIKARTPKKWLMKLNDWCSDNRWDI